MSKNAFFGLLVILLAFAFIGCDNRNGGNNFEGSWLGWNGDGSSEKIWEFNGNEFIAIIADINHAKGTFSYTETILTINVTHAWDESNWLTLSEAFGGEEEVSTFSVAYSINGNELTIEGDGNGQPFIKIQNSQ